MTKTTTQADGEAVPATGDPSDFDRGKPQKDSFDKASTAARRCARKLMKDGVPPTITADGLMCQAMAAWAAETGRDRDAVALLAIWAAVRDAH